MVKLRLMRRQASRVCVLACLAWSLGIPPVGAADSARVREMIAELSDATGAGDLAAIYKAISEIPQESDRLELKQALYAKLDALFEPGPQPREDAAAIDQQPAPSLTEADQASLNALDMEAARRRFRWQIEMLPLGPEATADTLRRRDRVVAEISQLSDPHIRDELLQLLEERERAADTSAAETLNQ